MAGKPLAVGGPAVPVEAVDRAGRPAALHGIDQDRVRRVLEQADERGARAVELLDHNSAALEVCGTQRVDHEPAGLIVARGRTDSEDA
ncbi:hypothetical protein Tbd_1264 [Thiobacillus denitrificans ATCC 25259]|uniref:Uncharacterized protein n=1 Tax=Thiobacillus denitrificans (strain ATCC 25259 / T1) TaxID=292415 RepID=Q3SJE7_THIDA|nr:hypothetical protein Tbd_1264 [Thiobacillus denitrificans ATCC 25259]